MDEASSIPSGYLPDLQSVVQRKLGRCMLHAAMRKTAEIDEFL